MKLFFRICLHLGPIFPFLLGYKYGAIALALLVGLGYIKVFKLRQELLDCSAKGDEEKAKSLGRALKFWQELTFLS